MKNMSAASFVARSSRSMPTPASCSGIIIRFKNRLWLLEERRRHATVRPGGRRDLVIADVRSEAQVDLCLDRQFIYGGDNGHPRRHLLRSNRRACARIFDQGLSHHLGLRHGGQTLRHSQWRKATGGSLDVSGPTIAGGMLYVNTGYGVFFGQHGNVLLVFVVAGE